MCRLLWLAGHWCCSSTVRQLGILARLEVGGWSASCCCHGGLIVWPLSRRRLRNAVWLPPAERGNVSDLKTQLGAVKEAVQREQVRLVHGCCVVVRMPWHGKQSRQCSASRCAWLGLMCAVWLLRSRLDPGQAQRKDAAFAINHFQTSA